MSYKIIKSESRGINEIDWLKSRFSFSFSNYYDPDRISFGSLRVINDDIISPSKGFSMHPHDNMEIITIINDGELLHEDSIGNKTVIKEGDVQVMSAGSGLLHSEINNSDKKTVSLFQIWIYPKEKNIIPRHEERNFEIKNNKLTLIASNKKNSLYIHQNAKIFLGKYQKEKQEIFHLKKNRGIYLMLIQGQIKINNQILDKRDAIQIENETEIKINFLKESKILLIEVSI